MSDNLHKHLWLLDCLDSISSHPLNHDFCHSGLQQPWQASGQPVLQSLCKIPLFLIAWCDFLPCSLFQILTQTESEQQQIIKETFQLVSKREDHVCNFLEGGSLVGGADFKLIYRHYATLYFVFCVDSSESELGILDLIQVRAKL